MRHAGKKVGTEPDSQQEIPSPATTVAAADEDATEMARARYQAHRMQTPQDKIRRMPATPALPRQFQSQELFRAQSVASTVADTVTPTSAKAANKKTGKMGKTKAVKKTGKKPIKKPHKTKTVKKFNKTRKGNAAKAKKTTVQKTTAEKTTALALTAEPAPAPAEPANDANVNTIPTLTPHMAEPVTPSAAAPTSPPQSPASADANLSSPAAPPKLDDPAAPAPHVAPETSTPHGLAAPTESKVKHEKPVTVKTEPDETKCSGSPQPESVASMLNRGQTTDLAALQALVTDTVKNAVASRNSPTCCVPSAESSPNAAVADLPKVRTRNKEMHNRRMRFYRTLDSHLDFKYCTNSPSMESCEHNKPVI